MTKTVKSTSLANISKPKNKILIVDLSSERTNLLAGFKQGTKLKFTKTDLEACIKKFEKTSIQSSNKSKTNMSTDKDNKTKTKDNKVQSKLLERAEKMNYTKFKAATKRNTNLNGISTLFKRTTRNDIKSAPKSKPAAVQTAKTRFRSAKARFLYQMDLCKNPNEVSLLLKLLPQNYKLDIGTKRKAEVKYYGFDEEVKEEIRRSGFKFGYVGIKKKHRNNCKIKKHKLQENKILKSIIKRKKLGRKPKTKYTKRVSWGSVTSRVLPPLMPERECQ